MLKKINFFLKCGLSVVGRGFFLGLRSGDGGAGGRLPDEGVTAGVTRTGLYSDFIRSGAIAAKLTMSIRRKEQGISQTDLAKRLGIHKNVLGRYERNEVLPSVEVARRIADILDVSLDFLTGKVDVEVDKTAQRRILEVSSFDEDDRGHVFSVIDAFIAKRKIQSIL